MIKKTVLILIVLLAAHFAVLQVFSSKFRILDENFHERNLRKAKTYLADHENFNQVIVGSSIGDRLTVDCFSEPTFNLSLIGRGVFEGLSIIEESGHIPTTIFIEINVLDRPKDESFIAETTQSFSLFNSSRENRPVEYSVWFLSQIKAGLGQGGPRPSTPPASSLNEIPRQEVVDNLIKKKSKTVADTSHA